MKPTFIAAFLGPKDGRLTGITENGDVWEFIYPDAIVHNGERITQHAEWRLICRGPVEPRN